ncbi:MAG: TrkH family potassium uptake protein [Oscillospiraceae bacterium]|nr:TrkH family potassium uptake protein [Oscillospiraceae bacterium]
MNYRLILLTLGRILILAAAAMIPSLVVAFLYNDGAQFSFIISIAALFAAGAIPLVLFKGSRGAMHPREGFVAVALCWIAISLFGALPPFISGTIPNFIDALFEMTAGFTTTGATILPTVESLPRSIIFWRGFSQWVGGMGVLMLTLIIMPSGDRGAQNIIRAESTGPASERIVPRIRKSVAILFAIYLTLTVVQTIMLLFGGLSLYDALLHAFTTAGTGGFSSRDASIGAFHSVYIEYTVGVFMILFSLNYGLYFAVLTRRIGQIRRNTELKVFLSLIAISTALIAADLVRSGIYETVSETVRHSFFQVSSLSSSTAFATTDYNRWPEFSRILLMCLMAVGACAGSTGGGLKVVRVVLLCKAVGGEVKKIIHPRAVRAVHLNGQPVQDKALTGVKHYFIIYVLIFIAAMVVVSVDNMGFETTFSSVLATISNTGHGFGRVGPGLNYSGFSDLSKIVLTLVMLIGRLEIFPILMLIAPSAWRRV